MLPTRYILYAPSHFGLHDKFAIVIMFTAQIKLSMLTAIMSKLNCPLYSIRAEIPDEIPSLKEIEGKKPRASTGLIKKLSSRAPSCKPCQVRSMSTTFSTIKVRANPMATLTFVSSAILLSPRLSLKY